VRPHGVTILGVDPGLRHTGWGVITSDGHRLSYIACGAIHPPAEVPLASRLHYLHEKLAAVIACYKPDTSAIEQTFVSGNASSTLKLGNARGALLLTLALHGLPVAEYDATLVKKSITGAGRADKTQIGMMVRTLLPACSNEASADALDALAVAITHSQYARMQALTHFPTR
jgi:crossover junction endodeoxyribonuclease RuvC